MERPSFYRPPVIGWLSSLWAFGGTGSIGHVLGLIIYHGAAEWTLHDFASTAPFFDTPLRVA